MKSQNIHKFIVSCLLTVILFFSFACQKQTQISIAEGEKANTPTEAYQMLFAAVKAKDTEKIKQLMSKKTLAFAASAGQNQEQSLEKVLENGLTKTTKTSSLPQIRDERVKDNFGSLEVYSQEKQEWEDLPFVLEDGGWKLAIGDFVKNTFKSPGKGRAQIEKEAANLMVKPNNNSSNANSNVVIMQDDNTKTVEVTPESKPKK